MNYTGSYESNTNRIFGVQNNVRASFSMISATNGTWYLEGRLSEYDDWETIDATNNDNVAPVLYNIRKYSEIRVVSSVSATVYYKIS